MHVELRAQHLHINDTMPPESTERVADEDMLDDPFPACRAQAATSSQYRNPAASPCGLAPEPGFGELHPFGDHRFGG